MQHISVLILKAVASYIGHVSVFYLSSEFVHHLCAALYWFLPFLTPIGGSATPLSTLALSGVGIALSLAVAHKILLTVDEHNPNELEALVQARTAELQAANQRLTTKLVVCQEWAAALAAEHAHLLEQAKEIAAAEERRRLARDLHDSVTQTLYSASLIAQVLPAVWQRSPTEGERNLIKLRQLVRGALAEMRTLLFELRPAALEAANLGVLLQQLGDVLTGHTRIPVTVTIDGETEPPTAIKSTMYRIAQEAFNNVAKHAGASSVDVALHLAPDNVSLHLRDNGRGFDPAQVPGEHMGVRIMAERAASVGARFRLVSAHGQGTTVSFAWSAVEPMTTAVDKPIDTPPPTG